MNPEIQKPRVSLPTDRGEESAAASDRCNHRNAPPCECNDCNAATKQADIVRAEFTAMVAVESAVHE